MSTDNANTASFEKRMTFRTEYCNILEYGPPAYPAVTMQAGEKGLRKESEMKFREEVLAKIFTYITVIVLLGIVIFEAWTTQSERSRRKEAEETIASAQDSLQKMIDLNDDLREKNEELEAFRNEWGPFAAFVDSKEVLTLKADLFMRSELIPKEAVDGLTALLEERAAEEASDGKDSAGKNEAQEETEEEAEMEFTFDNPEGENIFLPMSTGLGNQETCLVYTAAYEKGGEHVMELLYEIDFMKQRSVVETDESGEMEWSCVAYQIGDGWQAVKGEETEQ